MNVNGRERGIEDEDGDGMDVEIGRAGYEFWIFLLPFFARCFFPVKEAGNFFEEIIGKCCDMVDRL